MTNQSTLAFTHEEVLEENKLSLARLRSLSLGIEAEKMKLEEEKIAAEVREKELKGQIKQQAQDIARLREKLRKQEIFEKNEENQKEIVKLVARTISQSENVSDLRKTMADLIAEIDECVALLAEN